MRRAIFAGLVLLLSCRAWYPKHADFPVPDCSASDVLCIDGHSGNPFPDGSALPSGKRPIAGQPFTVAILGAADAGGRFQLEAAGSSAHGCPPGPTAHKPRHDDEGVDWRTVTELTFIVPGDQPRVVVKASHTVASPALAQEAGLTSCEADAGVEEFSHEYALVIASTRESTHLGSNGPFAELPAALRGLCERDSVFCIDDTLNPLPDERSPERSQGERITLVVLGHATTGGGLRLESPNAVGPTTFCLDALQHNADGGAPATRDGDASLDAEAGDAEGGPEAPKADWRQLASLYVNVAGPTTTVRARREADCSINARVTSERAFEFTAPASGYFFEPVVLFPTIFDGVRKASVTPNASGRNGVVHVSRSAAGAFENVSLGINVFPFGFPPSASGGSIAALLPWWGLSSCSQVHDIRSLRCVLSYAIGPFGVQGAVSLANQAFREYMIGGQYSLIRGVSLSMGAAILPGDFLGPNVFEGQIVAKDATIPMIQKYMFQPYFGVSISPEILQVVLEILNKGKTIVPNHPNSTN